FDESEYLPTIPRGCRVANDRFCSIRMRVPFRSVNVRRICPSATVPSIPLSLKINVRSFKDLLRYYVLLRRKGSRACIPRRRSGKSGKNLAERGDGRAFIPTRWRSGNGLAEATS